jgi:hypothetical protein
VALDVMLPLPRKGPREGTPGRDPGKGPREGTPGRDPGKGPGSPWWNGSGTATHTYAHTPPHTQAADIVRTSHGERDEVTLRLADEGVAEKVAAAVAEGKTVLLSSTLHASEAGPLQAVLVAYDAAMAAEYADVTCPPHRLYVVSLHVPSASSGGCRAC